MNWGFRGFAYLFETALLPCLLIALALLALSVVTWAILFTKYSMVGKANRLNLRFFSAFRKSQSALDPYEAKFSVQGSPLYVIYRTGCRELLFQLLGRPEVEGSLQQHIERARPLHQAQLEPVRSEMHRAVGEMTLQLERKMAFLSSVISGAPFLGLLGTVWGIMAVFASVAMSDAVPTVQSIAPGVASALVTTVLALLVATPALFAYNFLVNRIRTLIQEMNNFSAELFSFFERNFVQYGAPMAQETAHGEDGMPSLSSMGAPAQQIQSPFSSTEQAGGYQESDDLGPAINPIAERARQRRPS